MFTNWISFYEFNSLSLSLFLELLTMNDTVTVHYVYDSEEEFEDVIASIKSMPVPSQNPDKPYWIHQGLWSIYDCLYSTGNESEFRKDMVRFAHSEKKKITSMRRQLRRQWAHKARRRNAFRAGVMLEGRVPLHDISSGDHDVITWRAPHRAP